MFKRSVLTVIVIAALAISALPAAAAGSPTGTSSDSPQAERVTVDREYALVQLNLAPLSTSVRTRPPQGKKINFNSDTVKSYRAQLAAQRKSFKIWLRNNAPAAKVTGEYDISLNAVALKLNGVPLSRIASAPMVKKAEYQGLYYPVVEDPDLALIDAMEAWALNGGSANAGMGVKVAIIDSGIDVTHPCFDDTGYPAQTQLGEHSFTNNKVIAAKVFHNKAVSRGYTAEAINAHGTHVAGTVACNFETPAEVAGIDIPYDISGVAPHALLGNYNIFPANVANARSEDIMNALDTAYADGFDVANMSIGGGASGIQDLLTIAVDNLDKANMVVAVAAGNEGPGHYTISSPGSAARALTAGASSVGHGLFTTVTVDGVAYDAIMGQFGQTTASGELDVLLDPASPFGGLSTACASLPADSLDGRIALLSRGVCDFTVKVQNVQDAGGVGAIVVNREPGIFTMGQNDNPVQPTIPAYMVDLSDRAALMAEDGSAASLDAPFYGYDAANDNIMGDFSSQGPTDVDFRVKPDVAAPGQNVLSSVPTAFCGGDPCFAFFSGTSMATPHLAGMAAIVRQQHPTWSAAQIRSAIVNTAVQGVLRDYDGVTVSTDPNISGAGMANLFNAVNARVAVDPVSVSFGAVPSGSGMTDTFAVKLTNISGAPMTYHVSVGAGGGGVSYSVSPSNVSIAAGASADVTVTMHANRNAAFGDHQDWLVISSAGVELAHAAVYTFIK